MVTHSALVNLSVERMPLRGYGCAPSPAGTALRAPTNERRRERERERIKKDDWQAVPELARRSGTRSYVAPGVPRIGPPFGTEDADFCHGFRTTL